MPALTWRWGAGSADYASNVVRVGDSEVWYSFQLIGTRRGAKRYDVTRYYREPWMTQGSLSTYLGQAKTSRGAQMMATRDLTRYRFNKMKRDTRTDVRQNPNRGVDMTLAEYAAKYDVLVSDHKSGAKYVVGPPEKSKWELFHLSDYTVTSVSGPTHWLAQQNPDANVICAWCDKPLRYDPEIPAGKLSHGICDKCAARLENEESGVKTNPNVRDIGDVVNDYASASDFLTPISGVGHKNERKIAAHTVVQRDGDDFVVRLYGTDIVRYHRGGDVTLDANGHRTHTTARRMNQLLPGWLTVKSRRGKGWYVWNVRTGHSIPFTDGMRLSPSGSLGGEVVRVNPLVGILGNPPKRGRATFLSKYRDIRWLREGHVKDSNVSVQVPAFHSAIIYGNEDAPNEIELYVQHKPTVNDVPVLHLRYDNESDGYVPVGNAFGYVTRRNPGSRSALPGSLAHLRQAGEELQTTARLAYQIKHAISRNVTEIRYVHAQDGKAYSHKFASGVRMYALENGAVVLIHDTKKLWGDFK